MRWSPAAALAFALALGVATPAGARPTVAVTHLEVPPRADAPRVTKELRELLAQAIRKASFGPGSAKKRIELTARLTEFAAEQRGDVLQIHCTMTGRIHGGNGARSRISFGGALKDREKLEHDVLRMVAHGLVARLAQIARTQAQNSAED